jgi:hypothetical protein
MNWWGLDTDVLTALYEAEKEKLKERLLDGVSWEDTREQRVVIAELSTILYKKLNPKYFTNPAEKANRRNGKDESPYNQP